MWLGHRSGRHYGGAVTRSAQRVVGIVVLLVCGMLTLPVVAYFADTGDGGNAENWIIPIALLAMAAIGAALAVALPGLAREGASTGRRALTGIVVGTARPVRRAGGLLVPAERAQRRLTLLATVVPWRRSRGRT